MGVGRSHSQTDASRRFSQKHCAVDGPKAQTLTDIVDAINKVLGKNDSINRVSFDKYMTKNATLDEGKKATELFVTFKSLFEGLANGDAAAVDLLMGVLLGCKPKDGVEFVEETLKRGGGCTWHENYSEIL